MAVLVAAWKSSILRPFSGSPPGASIRSIRSACVSDGMLHAEPPARSAIEPQDRPRAAPCRARRSRENRRFTHPPACARDAVEERIAVEGPGRYALHAVDKSGSEARCTFISCSGRAGRRPARTTSKSGAVAATRRSCRLTKLPKWSPREIGAVLTHGGAVPWFQQIRKNVARQANSSSSCPL